MPVEPEGQGGKGARGAGWTKGGWGLGGGVIVTPNLLALIEAKLSSLNYLLLILVPQKFLDFPAARAHSYLMLKISVL